MLEEFFINTLKLNKKDIKYLEILIYENIWQKKEFYNFLLKHQYYINIYQSKKISEKLKEIGVILNEKS